MPPELQALLAQLLTAAAALGVGLFVDIVAELFGVDLSEHASAIVALAVNVGLAFAGGLFAKIPPEFAPYVATILILVLTWVVKYASRKQLRVARAKAKIKVAAFWNK